MKVLLRIALVFALALTLVMPVSAAEQPALIITEIVADNNCSVDGSSKDAFEFLEVCNISDREINLYDYSLVYASDTTKTTVPAKATNIIPGKTSTSLVDTTLTPDNPETAILKPGDVAVLWLWNFDSYKIAASRDDFRNHFGIGTDVNIIVVDGDANNNKTGNPERFNLANSGHRLYGIALKDFKVKESLDAVLSYIVTDFDVLGKSQTDKSFNSVYDASASDPRSVKIIDVYADATPGKLTDAQHDALKIEQLTAPAPVTTAAPVTTTAPAATPATADQLLPMAATALMALLVCGLLRQKSRA